MLLVGNKDIKEIRTILGENVKTSEQIAQRLWVYRQQTLRELLDALLDTREVLIARLEQRKKNNEKFQENTPKTELYDRGYYAGKIELATEILMLIHNPKRES